jgi:hypothetical protein
MSRNRRSSESRQLNQRHGGRRAPGRITKAMPVLREDHPEHATEQAAD